MKQSFSFTLHLFFKSYTCPYNVARSVSPSPSSADRLTPNTASNCIKGFTSGIKVTFNELIYGNMKAIFGVKLHLNSSPRGLHAVFAPGFEMGDIFDIRYAALPTFCKKDFLKGGLLFDVRNNRFMFWASMPRNDVR